jgi:hypothetical protein
MTPIITGAIFVGIALHGGWLQGATTADLIGLLADGFQRAVREHDDVSAELDVNHPEILKHLTEAPASRNRLKRSLRLEERARMRVNKLGAQSSICSEQGRYMAACAAHRPFAWTLTWRS